MMTLNSSNIIEIIELYNNGLQLTKIANIYHKRPSTISKILQDNNVPLKKSRRINRNLNENYFDIIDTEEKAYFLGILYTDGSIISDKCKQRSPMITLELTNEDLYIIEYFKKEINCESKICYNKRSNTYSIKFRSMHMANILGQYDIIPNKTNLIHNIPISKIPEHLQRHFIRGILDGDGSIYVSQNILHISYTTHYCDTATIFAQFCDFIINKECHNKIQLYKNTAKITYSGKWAIKLSQYIYNKANIFIKRKYLIAKQYMVEDIV